LADWKVPLFDLDLGADEQQAVREVLDSRWLTMGKVTEDFESAFAEYLGVKHAIAVSSGTAALHLACLVLGAGPNHKVICPSLTFVATANAILYTGATPVFADISSLDDLTISPSDIESKIDHDTKGIVVVHYGGVLCHMDRIMAIARKHDLFVVEDAAHAVGAEYIASNEGQSSKLPSEMTPTGRGFHGAGKGESSMKEELGSKLKAESSRREGRKVGTIGDIGCFSFFSNKNMTTGEGGMVVTDRDDLADRIRLARSHGMTELTWDRYKGHSYSYDVVDLGFNYRMDEIRAGLGLVQLKKLHTNNKKRSLLWILYREKLEGIEEIRVPFAKMRGVSSCHIFPVLLADQVDRKDFMDYLRAHGIQTSIHYPPVHLFSYYRNLKTSHAVVPLTEDVGRWEVTLPLFPTMEEGQVEYVVESIKDYMVG
jgi:dTDP-4-amino-4,6-dideoxygalactose transaminase